jgi:hypothetical protein
MINPALAGTITGRQRLGYPVPEKNCRKKAQEAQEKKEMFEPCAVAPAELICALEVQEFPAARAHLRFGATRYRLSCPQPTPSRVSRSAGYVTPLQGGDFTQYLSA